MKTSLKITSIVLATILALGAGSSTAWAANGKHQAKATATVKAGHHSVIRPTAKAGGKKAGHKGKKGHKRHYRVPGKATP